MSAPAPAALPGIDLPRVTAWLHEALPDAVPPLRLARVGDGRSNLTFRVEDATGGRWILRRPPLGPRLPSAHDVAREHRLLAALHPAGVPVPAPLGLCEDERVSGAPLLLMEHAPGRVLADRDDAEALAPAARHAAGIALVETLARLHAVDADAVGLGDLARREGYAARQLRRWMRQWEASRTRPVPAIERVHALLADAIPPQRATAIVHGDYKLENVAVDDVGAVRAILDWELCTLGDPLADLGLLLVYWSEPGDDPAAGVAERAPTRVPGFPTRDALVERYARASGADLGSLTFHRALAAWKLAIVIAGVVRRFRETPGNANADPAALDARVDALAAEAERIARACRTCT